MLVVKNASAAAKYEFLPYQHFPYSTDNVQNHLVPLFLCVKGGGGVNHKE